MSTISKGYPTDKAEGNVKHVTVQPEGSGRYGVDVVNRGATIVGSDAAEAASTSSKIVATAHAAKAGNMIRWTSGAMSGEEYAVLSVLTNSITTPTMSAVPSAGNTFDIMRYVTPTYDGDGDLFVTPGPLAIKVDGVTTDVDFDSGTPASSVAVPVYVVGGGGTGGATEATQLDVLAAVESIDTKTPALSGGSVPVVGPLTDTQLRAVAVPVSIATVPLATDAATATLQTAGNVLSGAVDETAPATDTASSGLNGRLQRIAQRLTSLIALLPTSLGQKAMAASLAVTVASDQTAIPASQSGTWNINNIAGAITLPTGAATDTLQTAGNTLLGAVTETAPASDTASSGLNGRLQRIAQRLTSLIALLPASLGQKTMSASLAVTLASDQSALSVSQTAFTGSYQEITNLTNSAQTFTAPAGSKWFKIQSDGSNAGNIRYKVGAAATVSSGMVLDPGRSEDNLMGGNISVICETSDTNQKVYVQFGV